MISPRASREILTRVEKISDSDELCTLLMERNYDQLEFAIRILIVKNPDLLIKTLTACQNDPTISAILKIFQVLNYYNPSLLNFLSTLYSECSLEEDIEKLVQGYTLDTREEFAKLISRPITDNKIRRKFVNFEDFIAALRNINETKDSLRQFLQTKDGHQVFNNLQKNEQKEIRSTLVTKIINYSSDYPHLINVLITIPDGLQLYLKLIETQLHSDLTLLNDQFIEGEDSKFEDTIKLKDVISKWQIHLRNLMEINNQESQSLLATIFKTHLRAYTFSYWNQYFQDNKIFNDLSEAVISTIYASHEKIVQLSFNKEEYTSNYITTMYSNQIKFYIEDFQNFSFVGYCTQLLELINYEPRNLPHKILNKIIDYLSKCENAIRILNKINLSNLPQNTVNHLNRVSNKLQEEKTRPIKNIDDYF